MEPPVGVAVITAESQTEQLAAKNKYFIGIFTLTVGVRFPRSYMRGALADSAGQQSVRCSV